MGDKIDFRKRPRRSHRGSKPRRRRLRGWRLPSPIWIIGPLAALTALYVSSGPPPGIALPQRRAPGVSLQGQDAESARFARCGSSSRETCVVDGDTFWYRGTKIRMLDINTPETSGADCPYERELGEQATRRLIEVLNAGPFTLEAENGNEQDRYGRALRRVTREGQSLGTVLVDEGLAEPWQGYRRNWC